MACVLFPNQRERKITISKVISLMESLTLLWDQNSTQKPVPEMQERQTTYRKIQELVPLQEKIKRRLKDKDQKTLKRTMLITNLRQLRINHDPHQ